MSLPAKYRLHATKVDRIAVVDRPAVPDARVILFKRKKDADPQTVAVKAIDFNREFVYKSTAAAVEVLEQGFWNVYYSQDVDAPTEWKALFKNFRSIVIDVINKIPPIEKQEKAEDAQAEPTIDEVVGQFERFLNLSVLSKAFEYFKNYLGYLMMSVGQSPNSEQIITKVIDVFEPHVIMHGNNALATYDKSLKVVVDKEGRVLSGARMKKLEEAMRVIQEILADAYQSPRLREKSKEEVIMEIQEIIKALAESELFKGLVAKLELIETTLKEHKLLLTPEEKTEIAKVEKEALEKRQAEETVAAEKKAKEDSEAKEKSEKEATEKADLEKKAKDEAEARLAGIEKALEAVTKVAEGIAKRMGIQTALKDEGKETEERGNAFDKALREKRK